MDHMAAYKTNKMYKVIGKKVLQNWALYLFLLPSAVILLLLNIIPMYGIQIAFKKFVANQGIWGSKWIGFSNFSNFFSSYMFSSLIKNTLAISLYSIVVSFPFPILLALLLNYCIHPKLKKTTQMVTYAPHFISTVVLIGMINVFFSSEGLVNTVRSRLHKRRSNTAAHAMMIIASSMETEISNSFARRRAAFIQAKVRSTIQRHGSFSHSCGLIFSEMSTRRRSC